MPTKIAIFTKEKALEKICPLGWSADGTCAGAKCMMWRWYVTNIKDPEHPGQLMPSSDTYGYCGLAGDPDARGKS